MEQQLLTRESRRVKDLFCWKYSGGIKGKGYQ